VCVCDTCFSCCIDVHIFVCIVSESVKERGRETDKSEKESERERDEHNPVLHPPILSMYVL